jgi:hypothetical protein
MLVDFSTVGTAMADRVKKDGKEWFRMPNGELVQARSKNKVQLSTLVAPDTLALLYALHEGREKETDSPMSLATYVDYMIRQEAKRQGLGESKTGRGSKSAR